ncbi:conserved phage C-terminal domain-containing protein [Mucilaginibacter sp. KACC 22773]|uniref:conserved phage C-terminal domain-containing protein n=1 Tax=Mucilaginibacter sp. KACC 22773 TaxID=3025671 RepID=UPI0023657A39|nr:conserved phage C-terminal domain-containing protein [Mucilaginibacter sp. KACC 22773]WDF79554.1 conserved phage C-terminal domain-containing protein [Mucilaginibacter sp. KACC 22773]
MSKETFYFSHDYGARNDPKLIKVLRVLGQAGKGVFWDLIELLYEQGGKLEMVEIDNYAFALRADAECINKLITDFDLFKNDGTFFWSESVNRRLNARAEKSKKAAASANKRWDKGQEDANASNEDAFALQTDSDGNAIKDNIVKDITVKDITVKDKNNNNDLATDVILYLNLKASKAYLPTTPKTLQLISARAKEGFSIEDFKKVIDVKTNEWLNDADQNKFLRPETLFGTKFEGYLNQVPANQVKKTGRMVY